MRSSVLSGNVPLLNISRPGLHYVPKGESALTLALMQEIDRAFTEWPFPGVRQMRDYLALLGYGAGIKRARRLMRLMGLMAVYQKPKTSVLHPGHTRYPYLLRDLAVTSPIRSGVRTSRISPCAKASCIW